MISILARRRGGREGGVGKGMGEGERGQEDRKGEKAARVEGGKRVGRWKNEH